MTMHVHHLTGCAPAPLAHYLKALGILRLVAEQADPQARGWWLDEHFCLMTTLDRDALERFFLDEYEPTPFVSPWNGGSGFFPSDNKTGFCAIEKTSAPRFEKYHDAITAGQKLCKTLGLKSKPDRKRKPELFQLAFRAWRGELSEWLHAAVVLDEGEPVFPSLLGTGGNDGRLDYTNNAMQRLGELFDLSGTAGKPNDQTPPQLEQALWLTPCNTQTSCAIGQFLPGNAGGANSTTAADGDSLVNPWDFILMLEGTILFSARATRRLDPQSLSRAVAPFVMHAHAAGFLSPGGEKDQRGEQWMPLWSRPSTLGDISAVLGEGRLDVGRHVAHRPLDAARAVARLGVARGVEAFTRYAYLERNGQSNLAVSLGRIVVQPRPLARLIDDIAPWLDRLHRQARGKNAPARLIHAERRLADAVFSVLTHDETPDRWQAVLRAMGAIEEIQAGGTAVQAGPIPKLNPQWIAVADDGSAEFRLAVSLGSAAAYYCRKEGRNVPVDPIRHHWLPLEKGARRFQINEKRLTRDVRVVMHGRDPVADLTALVERRFIESTMGNREQRRLPLIAACDCGASLTDLADLLAGHVDLARVSELARAFMAVDWPQLQRDQLPEPPEHRAMPDEAWLAVRLAALPWPLDDNHDIRAEPAMIRRLSAGDGQGAVQIALRRLRAVGFRQPMQSAFADAQTARLWAAALAFPISKQTARRAACILDPNYRSY